LVVVLRNVDSISHTTRTGQPCAVCLESTKNPALLEECMHIFCLECIREWWKIKQSCPLCKKVSQFALCEVKSSTEFTKWNLESNLLHNHSWWTKRHQFRHMVYARGLSPVTPNQPSGNVGASSTAKRARRASSSSSCSSALMTPFERSIAQAEGESKAKLRQIDASPSPSAVTKNERIELHKVCT
jgi:hypothetical protein